MDSAFPPPDNNLPERPRWRIGSAIFDEGAWSLQVAGERVRLENKPLLLLRTLLHHPGQTLSKDRLLDEVWPGLTVVEASLPTAMNKLRRALGDAEGQIIETVPGIGYRLAAPIEILTDEPQAMRPKLDAAAALPALRPRRARRLALWGVALAAPLVIAAGWARFAASEPVTRTEAFAALRALDTRAVTALLDRGWDPNMPLDDQRNTALNRILEVCEGGSDHDRQRLEAIVRLLMDSGARATIRNVWGDTAYSIANANRYCGPDHPATRALRAACTNPAGQIIPECQADYARSDWPQMPSRAGQTR